MNDKMKGHILLRLAYLSLQVHNMVVKFASGNYKVTRITSAIRSAFSAGRPYDVTLESKIFSRPTLAQPQIKITGCLPKIIAHQDKHEMDQLKYNATFQSGFRQSDKLSSSQSFRPTIPQTFHNLCYLNYP